MCEEEPTCRNLVAQELPLADCERDVILRTLEAHQGNKTATAEALGISRRSIYNKLAEYGLSPGPGMELIGNPNDPSEVAMNDHM